MSIQPPSGSVTPFYSYAHEDEELRNQLDKHLRLLQRLGYLSIRSDHDIHAGDDWANEINTHLESAQIILLLISADFLASEYCYGVEMQRAIERHATGEARVIPIILRPVDWEHSVLGRFQALPTDGKPVTDWPSPPHYDAAFKDIAQGIRQVVEDLLSGHYKPEQRVLAVKESTNQHLQEQRRATCLRLLISVRKFVSILAEYRQAHDDLLIRAKRAFTASQHVQRVKAQMQSIQDELILAGSELSIDPQGKGVMDAFGAYMQAQIRYFQAMAKPMKSPLTFPFGKADTAVLDTLVEQANEQLSVLEKVAQDFIQSS